MTRHVNARGEPGQVSPPHPNVKEDLRQIKEASRALKLRATALKSTSDRLVLESTFLLGTVPLTQQDR